jgi:hypothetical protein
MANKQIAITFRVEAQQGAALLKVLRCVLPDRVKRALDSPAEVKAFGAASERLHVVLRRTLEGDDGSPRSWAV